MGLRFLEHFLILTDEPEKTRDWWVDTLGFRSGDHPEFGFPVYWLYIGDQDVVHIGQRNHSEHQNAYLQAPTSEDGETVAANGDATAAESTGRLDHLCFNCDGIEEAIERLERNNVDFSERQAHSQAFHQVFFYEPINNIKIELNFPAEEARLAGRAATINADGATPR